MNNKGKVYSESRRGKRIISILPLMLALLCLASVSLPLPAAAMPLPVGMQNFKYNAEALPVGVPEPALAQPFGLGSVAEAGDKLSIQVGFEAFDGPVDIYLGIAAPKIDPDNVYLVIPGNSVQPVSQGIVPWKTNISGPLNEGIFGDIPVSALPPGPYYFYLAVTPAGSLNSYYVWETQADLFSLAVNKTGSGSVSSDVGGIDCGDTCVRTYAAGAAVGLDAAPGVDEDFLKWGGCDVTSGTACALVMNQDRTVTPMFGTPLEINPNVKIINENITQCLTVTNNPDSSVTYSFELGKCPDQETELSHLSEGDVLIVNDVGLPAIMRITAVDSLMPQSIVVETVKGSLFDLADRGTIAYSGTLSPPESTSSSSATAKIGKAEVSGCTPELSNPDESSDIGIQVNLGPDCKLTWGDSGNEVSVGLTGYANLLADMYFGYSWSWGSLDWVRAGLKVTQTTDLTVKVHADLNKEDRANLYSNILGVIPIGPILIVPNFRVDAFISGQSKMLFTTGLTTTIGFDVGMEYTPKKGFGPFGEPIANYTFKSTRLTTSSQLKAGLQPEIGFMLYDAAGLTFGVHGYLKIEANTDQDKINWCLYGGGGVNLGALIQVPIEHSEIAKEDWLLPLFEEQIAGTCETGLEVPVGPNQEVQIVTASIETPANPFYTNRNKMPVSFKGAVVENSVQGKVTTCLWDFGDNTAVAKSVIYDNGECKITHNYADDGVYPVTLTAANSDDSNTATITATAASRVSVYTVPPPPPSNVTITSLTFKTPARLSKSPSPTDLKPELLYNVTWDPPRLRGFPIRTITYKTTLTARAEDATVLSREVQSLPYNHDVITFGHKAAKLCYQVVSVDQYGNESDPFAPTTYTCIGETHPQMKVLNNPSTILAGLATSNQLTWSEINGKNLSYTIYRDDVAVKTLFSPPFYDTGLTPGRRHCYKIGLKQKGKLIDTSGETCLTTSTDATSPSTPPGFAAVAVSPDAINLSWSPATDNIGVAGYRIYNSNTTGLTYRTAAVGTSLSVSGLSADTAYCFKVSAYDRAGNESPKSAQVCATIPNAGVACTYTLSPTNDTYYSAEGGSGSFAGRFSVTASGSSCSWSATSSANWITITAGNSGTGSGTGIYIVSPNSAVAGRTGTIRVGDQTFTVTQDGQPSCTYTLSPTNNTYYSAEGGSGSFAGRFSVTTSGSSCSWSATSSANWITITAGNSGTGSATGTYIVAPNNSIAGRTGTIRVGDQAFTVTQDGQPCAVTLSPTSQNIDSLDGGPGEFGVTTSDSNCSWTATSNADWITITSGSSGVGNGRVSYMVSARAGGSPSRTGTITVGDQTFTVTNN
ncbi:MAG: hypothetical protein C0402_14930 [Thermodesulfovibrio sp.]|nr:hypothetical protein [Thermodesulfovibrio sp.]